MVLIKYTAVAVLGLDCISLVIKPNKGRWSSYMVHALEDGTLKELWISDHAKEHLIEQIFQVILGYRVNKFSG